MKKLGKFIVGIFLLLLFFYCLGLLGDFVLQCEIDNCTNKRLDYSQYCAEHTCKVDNCKQLKWEPSDYCYSHKCIAVGCINQRSSDSEYCSEHSPKPNPKKTDTQNNRQKSSNTTSTSTSNHPYSLDEDEKIVLWMAAEDAIEARLKSPSSAKFPFAYNSDGVTFNYDNSTGIATFWGWVEAENDYGATVRTDWMVDFYVEDDTYKVTNVEFF